MADKLGDQKPPEFFAAETDALDRQIAGKLAGVCTSGYATKAAYEACLRNKIVAAFDDSGAGIRNCAHLAQLDAFAECLITGNVVLDVMRRLRDDTPLASDFWSGKNAMMQTLARAIVVGGVTNCRDSIATPAASGCIDGWLRDRLDLTPELMRRCPAGTDDPNRRACIGEAIALKYLQDRVQRLGEVGA